MLTQNLIPNFLVKSSETFAGYWNWNISTESGPLSKAFKRMIGFEMAAHEKPFAFIKHIFREDLNEAMELYHKHAASNGIIPFEIILRYYHTSGSILYTLCKGGITEWGNNGTPLKMTGCHMDITGFISGKTELEKQHEQHLLLTEGINAGIWDWDIKTDHTWWSDKFFSLLGYVQGEITASYDIFLHRLVHVDDRKKMLNALQEHFINHTPCIIDIRLQRHDGSYHWYELSGKAKFNDKGKPVRMLLALIDCDQRKRLRNELERYQFLINESTALIKAGSWEINLASGAVIWSPSMYTICEAGERFKPTAENMFQFSDESFAGLFKVMLEKARTLGEAFDKEAECITLSGNKKWLRIIGKPVINKYGKITAIRGITQDIQEQKLKDAQIKQSIDVITEKNKQLNSFAQIVSHNLRSHAGNIETILSLIEVNHEPDKKKELLYYMRKISSNLNQTIDHLSEIVKIQNSADIPKTIISLEQILKNVTDVLTPSIIETSAEISMEMSAYADIEYVPAYMESILLNLLSNAIKYRKPDTAPLIAIKTYMEDNRKCLSISDNGLGIDLSKHRDKLFGMYKTFHTNADARGIGLFLTKSQIESLGGTIDAVSEPGNGTTFYIRF